MSVRGAGAELVPRYGRGATTAVVTGVLDLASYPEVRDGLLKIATEAPEGLIADIDGLEMPDSSLVNVFVLVATRISDWPGVPFALVSHRPGHQAMLATMTVNRFVSVHDDRDTAEQQLVRPPRRRAAQLLARSSRASSLARGFVTRMCAEWGVPSRTDDAMLIATEFVENAIRHTDSMPRLRLELRRGIFSIAVSDDDPRPAVLLERLSILEPGLGLRMVAQTAKVWGCSRSWSGGKTVWAVLPRCAEPAGHGRHE